MAETAFDRTERGLGSADLSIPDIVARTKGNPQDIMKLVMSGQINVTQGLLAKRLSDSVVAERSAMAAQCHKQHFPCLHKWVHRWVPPLRRVCLPHKAVLAA
jgi:hypothetical protein